MTRRPPRTSQTTGDTPSSDRGAGLGSHQAPDPRAQDAEHGQGEADDGEHRTHQVERHPRLGGGVLTRAERRPG